MSTTDHVVRHYEQATIAPTTIDRELVRWQRRLLPFMTTFVVAMAIAFFLFSGAHLYRVTSFIESGHGQNIREQIAHEIESVPPGARNNDSVLRNSLLLLEADALDKRYHQASALLMARIWSRQLAFITGMVMAFLGAVFILGKLSESSSQISGEAQGWKVAISSASPGIILSLFGTILLIASMLVRANLDVSDGPAYLNLLHPVTQIVPQSERIPTTAPSTAPSLEELQRLSNGKRSNQDAKQEK